jgi:hypothetical protein
MRLWLRRGVTGSVRGLALLLLVLQATADGAIAVAHATDPSDGPAALESQHTAQCLILHDAARCTQCQYHTSRTLPATKRRVPHLIGATRRVHGPDRTLSAAFQAGIPTTQPRAPPAPLS